VAEAISMTAVGRASIAQRFDEAVCSRKPRRLEIPVSASVRAAARCRYSVRSLAIASKMNAIEMVNSSASRLKVSSQALNDRSLAGDMCSNMPSGVRSRNSAPWANSMKIAGQRDTSASSRPRPNS
jgi:hypothetical protein